MFAKLQDALNYLLNFRDQLTVEPTVLGKVAAHHRALRVTPEQFDKFAQSLLDTLREFSGERDAVIDAWKMQCGQVLPISRNTRPRPRHAIAMQRKMPDSIGSSRANAHRYNDSPSLQCMTERKVLAATPRGEHASHRHQDAVHHV
jgi:hypothetical protein